MPGIVATRRATTRPSNSAKLSIADTGTSFIAGQSLSTTDDKWLRKIGAEQKLFGGVTISGSIGETALGTPNKSSQRGLQAQLVGRSARPLHRHIPRKIEHCRILVAMRSKSTALMAPLNFVVRGTTALAYTRNRGIADERHHPFRTDVESTEVDTDLAAVSEVEAGIRDFVRNDVAYLRRPPTLTPDAARSSRAPRPPSTTSTR